MAQGRRLRTRQVSEQATARHVTWTGRVADPVVAILVVAGVVDGIAGNPVHALLLAGAGMGLVVVPPRRETSQQGMVPAEAPPQARRWWRVGVPVAIAYGVVVGGFERYTWPVTFAIVVPGVIGIVVASRAEAPATVPPAKSGTWLWAAALVSVGVFELVNFVLQPSRLEGSFDHPTLSTVFNDVVIGHPSQAIALATWLLIGWWLVER